MREFAIGKQHAKSGDPPGDLGLRGTSGPPGIRRGFGFASDPPGIWVYL